MKVELTCGVVVNMRRKKKPLPHVHRPGVCFCPDSLPEHLPWEPAPKEESSEEEEESSEEEEESSEAQEESSEEATSSMSAEDEEESTEEDDE